MITPAMDLAKMLAKIMLIESLHDKDFTSYRQARAGLLHLSPRENVAKGQLAASTVNALQIKPHIIHVVGYCEGDHAAEAADVIESCEIVQGLSGIALRATRIPWRILRLSHAETNCWRKLPKF